MKITLDRPALRALIDADPEFSLSLKNAVLSEVQLLADKLTLVHRV